MTKENEVFYIQKIARLTKLDPETIQRIINAQAAVFLLDLSLRGRSQTPFGEIVSENRALKFGSLNSQIRQLSSKREVAEKLSLELPPDLT